MFLELEVKKSSNSGLTILLNLCEKHSLNQWNRPLRMGQGVGRQNITEIKSLSFGFLIHITGLDDGIKMDLIQSSSLSQSGPVLFQ